MDNKLVMDDVINTFFPASDVAPGKSLFEGRVWEVLGNIDVPELPDEAAEYYPQQGDKIKFESRCQGRLTCHRLGGNAQPRFSQAEFMLIGADTAISAPLEINSIEGHFVVVFAKVMPGDDGKKQKQMHSQPVFFHNGNITRGGWFCRDGDD